MRAEALRERTAADALRPVPLDAYAAFLFVCVCSSIARTQLAQNQHAAQLRARTRVRRATIVHELYFHYFLYLLAFLMFEG